MMIHIDYIKNLTIEELLEMIEDYRTLHFKTGVLPPNSKIRDLARVICDSFSIDYNITYGEDALLEEIMDRFYKEHKQPNEGWIPITEKLPTEEGYYQVKYMDGSEDEKPFRIRPTHNIYGFMTENEVTHWK